MMPYVIISIFLTLMISIYVVSYIANNKEEVPAHLKERYDEAQTCSGCNVKREMLIPEEVIIEFKEDNFL